MGTVSFFPSFFSRCFFKPKATFSLQPLETGIQAFYYPNSLRGILTKHRRSLTVSLNELNFHRSNSLPVASICFIYVTFYSIRLLIALCGNQIVPTLVVRFIAKRRCDPKSYYLQICPTSRTITSCSVALTLEIKIIDGLHIYVKLTTGSFTEQREVSFDRCTLIAGTLNTPCVWSFL